MKPELRTGTNSARAPAVSSSGGVVAAWQHVLWQTIRLIELTGLYSMVSQLDGLTNSQHVYQLHALLNVHLWST